MATNNTLKTLRSSMGLTQAQVAKKIGVSQPNYQRWEAGVVPIPADKLPKLAKVLRTTSDALTGKTRYSQVAMTRGDRDFIYWGEAAVHFKSGAEPIVFSISASEYTRLQAVLQDPTNAFFEALGLCNEHYVIRRDAISEVYLSDEAGDWLGAPDTKYPGFIAVQITDSRLWDALSSYFDDNEEADTPQEDLVQALSYFMTRDMIAKHLKLVGQTSPLKKTATSVDQNHKVMFDALGIATSHVDDDTDAEELESRKSFILDRASTTLVRLSNGTERRFSGIDSDDINFNVSMLVDRQPGDNGVLVFLFQDDPQEAYFATNAIDFVRFPAHHVERAMNESNQDIE